MPKEHKPAKHKRRKKEERLRGEGSARAFTYNYQVAQEFTELLEESDFVSKVINIYLREEMREFDFYEKYGMTPSRSRFERNFHRQADFIRQYLPERLYQATDTLFLEAVLASIGRPMLRSLATNLYNSIFIRRSSTSPPLREGRDNIWDSTTLRWAIHCALPTIKNPRNVTLAVLAKKINALPRTDLLKNIKKDLTGKYLQMLFKEHEINWMHIKNLYKRFLVEKERPQKST